MPGTKPPFRPDDRVHHAPSGETWVVAYADPETGRLSWCGWPEGEALISDCTLVRAASDEASAALRAKLIAGGGRRGATVARLYPARPGESRETSWPDAVPGAGQAAEVEEIGVQQGAPSGTGSRASIEPADAVSPASGGVDPSRGETLQTIAQWCEETFGPATAERIASRAAEEMDELLADPHKVEEAADVVIILSRHPTLWAEVERKMAVNRKRQWRLKGDGSGYHIPAPGIETGTATTEGRGAKHESPIAAGEALSPTPPDLIQAAREALEPFAKAAQAEHMRHIKDDQRLFLESRAEVVITENLRGGHFRAAQAALRALQSPVRQEEGSRPEVPDGWVLVPRDPTLAMQNAGWGEIDRQGFAAEDTEVAPIYRAMLSAAPTPDANSGGEAPGRNERTQRKTPRPTLREMTDAELLAESTRMDWRIAQARADIAESGGCAGAPFESLYEEADDIDAEMSRRGLSASPRPSSKEGQGDA